MTYVHNQLKMQSGFKKGHRRCRSRRRRRRRSKHPINLTPFFCIQNHV